MNNELTDLEMQELSENLKTKFSRISFDQPVPRLNAHKARKLGLSAVGSVAVAAFAFVALSPSGSSPAWAAEPTELTDSQIQKINTSCETMANKAGILSESKNQLPPVIASDFRGGIGFSVFSTEETGPNITCNFEEKNGEFKVIGIEASFGDSTSVGINGEQATVGIVKISKNGEEIQDTTIFSTLKVKSFDPEFLWNGEGVSVSLGALAEGATSVELRSDKYPTWRASIHGNFWSMLVPSAIVGTLVQLNSSGEIIQENPFTSNK